MPPKQGVGGSARNRNRSLDSGPRRPPSTPIGPKTNGNELAAKSNQPQHSIAPLILEGVKLNKLQLNDMVKQHLSDIKLRDIQLSRAGIFTLYSADVKSFNRLLNDFPAILSSNGQATAKVYVPRSIQRIKDTEKVAFVKRVDLEIPNDRITEALKHVGLDVTDVSRLSSKDGNTPTRTVKITLSDVANRNTFVHTGLQVDSMHFVAEPASQNKKPVQCYICMKYNHVAKYCKTKQQICARCGENHRLDQCNAAKDVMKCCNCNGNHLATSPECSNYKEQEKRALNLISQYSAGNKPIPQAPALHSASEFPPLPNVFQQGQEHLQKDFFEEIINILSTKMEKIIEETTSRLFHSLKQKIEKLEKSMTTSQRTTTNQPATTRKRTATNKPTTTNEKEPEDALTVSDSELSEESEMVKQMKEKYPRKTATKKPAAIPTEAAAKPSQTRKGTDKQKNKRVLSPNSSLDKSAIENKDQKTSNND